VKQDTKHFDDLFRRKFESFEVQPPEGVWERIKANLPNGGSGTLFSNPISIASIAAMALISLIIGLIFVKQPSPVILSSSSSLENVIATPDNSGNESSTFTLSEPSTQTNASEINEIAPAITPKRATTFGKQFDDEAVVIAPQEKPGNLSSIELSDNIKLDTRPATSNSINLNAEREELTASFGQKKKKFRMPPQWFFGAHLTPEVIFYPNDDVQNQTGYIVDLSASLHYTDYFIESGIGLNFSKDEGAYDINYEPFLGTYDDVYRVTFDSTENGIVPIYHTRPVDVYDSVKQIYEPTKNRYTYLQIPLFFGFRKQVHNFTLFAKGGPTFAILIHENVTTPSIGDKDRIMHVDETQPGRVSTNWQVVLSAGMNYRLAKNLSVSLEPVFRYYVRSAYERNYLQSKHPYAIGLRAGLLFNL
jgi:hypothetical protein